MKQREHRIIIINIVMLIALIVMAVFAITVGSANIGISEVVRLITGRAMDATSYNIIVNIRLPRVIAAIFLGGALAVSGFLLQAFFGNPIAGPYVLGISSGSKLTVAIAMIVLLNHGIKISAAGMVVAAFLGAALSTGFVLALAGKLRKMSMLIICGILIGYICSAITDFMVTFASDSNIVNLHNWSLGSFSGIENNDIVVIIAVVTVTVIITFIFSKPIYAYQMGEEYAAGVGVNTKALRITIILLSSLLSASVTAFAGPISFVGIAVPHLYKLMSKTSKPIYMIPGCMICGAIITLFSDIIARTVFAPTELSISSVTAILLVPVVIAMMLGREERYGD